MKVGYKGFGPGLVCRGYHFKVGVPNIEPKAKTAGCGFHYAENPLDCLSYYPDTKRAVYCIVSGDGDIDEDGIDSKISCTELTILRELSLREYILHCLVWICKHPSDRNFVREVRAEAANGYCIVTGRDPTAKGKAGDVVGLIRTAKGGKAEQIAVYEINKENEGKWINIEGQIKE